MIISITDLEESGISPAMWRFMLL